MTIVHILLATCGAELALWAIHKFAQALSRPSRRSAMGQLLRNLDRSRASTVPGSL